MIKKEIKQQIDNAIGHYATITLKETKKVRLMRRTDTKYVIAVAKLPAILEALSEDYFIQVNLSNSRLAEYHTVYFDTKDMALFYRHEHGHKVRDKVRIREYMDNHECFLEHKHKDNHGKTHKKRVLYKGDMCEQDIEHSEYFFDEISQMMTYAHGLIPQIENSFCRITLVSRSMTERVTIDTDICFHNLVTNKDDALPQLAIIELKRDGMASSKVHNLLRELHIHPMGFSKYCIGTTLTNPNLRINNIKEKITKINKIWNNY